MERIEGLSIDLALDTTRLNRGLTGLRDKLRSLNTEMAANLSAFDRGDRSIARNEARLNSLNRKLEVQKEITKAARQEYEKMVQQHGEGSREADRAASAYNREVSNLNNLNRSINNATQELTRMREAQRVAETGWGRLGARLTNLSGRLTSLGQGMQNVGRSMTQSFGVATAAVGGVLALSTKKAMDFEAQMSSVKSVMAPDEVKQFGGALQDLAVTMGAKTKYSATEAAQGIEELIKAGVSVKDIMSGGLDGALSLATAGELELGDAAEIASTALNAFRKDGLSVSRAADILAGAANASATDVGELKFGLSMVSAVASGVGLTFEDTSTALAAFAQNGLKGSDAGTSLKTMLLNLSPHTKAAQDQMDSLGLATSNTTAAYNWLADRGMKPASKSSDDVIKSLEKLAKIQAGSGASASKVAKEYDKLAKFSGFASSAFYDENGNLKSMSDIAGILKDALKDLNSEQRQQALQTMFGTDAIRAGNILYKEGAEGIKNMNKEMNKVKAADVAKEKLNNLKGVIEQLHGSVETAQISIGNALIPALRGLTNILQKGVDWFNKLSPSMQKMIAIGGAVTAIFLALGTGLGIMLTVMGGAISGMGALAGGLGRLFPAIARAGGLLNWIKSGLMALTGPVGIVIGVISLLTVGFVALYKNSATFRAGIQKLLSNVKQLAQDALKALQPAIQTVIQFFKSQLAVLKQFWQQNGTVIVQAIMNIGKVIGAVFKGIFAVIKFIMPAVLIVVKMVWDNIKGTISGAIKIIMGVIKIFAGLFTGNFGKMWEGIKQLFVGAIQFIWNFVQLMFWGRMLKGILSLGKLLINGFKGAWGGIKNVFSTVIEWIVNFVKNRFNTARNLINGTMTGIKNIIRTIWNAVVNVFSTVLKTILDFVRLRFNTLRNNISTVFNAIRDLTKTIWNTIKDYIYNPIKNAVTNAIRGFTNLKSKISEIFGTIKTKVAGYVSDMIENVKSMPGKMADGIQRAAGKIKSAMTSVGNFMLSGIGNGVNGVITGINWVLDKLGVSKKLKKWEVPQYAQGTDGHPGGLAVVGDGKGSNSGRELIQTPDGNKFLSPSSPTLINLPKGTQVLPASLTKQLIPHYAWGTDLWNGTKKFAANAWNKTKDIALDVWEYASDPKKLLNLALDKLGISIPSATDVIGEIAKGGFSKVKDSAFGFIKKQLDEFASSVPDAGSGVQRWAGIATKALKMTNQFTAANLKALLYQMDTESSGNPKAINLWDSNAKRGTPSKGLMQVIDPTFRTYAMPGFNKNIWDPMSNILASIRYAVSRYGSLAKAYRGVGYASGGLIKNSGLYNLAEGGYPEWVIPTDPSKRTDAMKLLALAGKQISGNKRPGQLPNVGSDNNNALEKLLDATLEQTKVLLQLLQSNKNPVVLNGRILTEEISKLQQTQTNRTNRMGGITT
ncbi:phage tail tape measure protein [Bacillus sp. UNC438CL73TsuS30]|uniref:phage tail tape measure protein n=1 Tax=Bacillus sp. UNC438CL73TsuS30 TaxID=1340434 RepID=UPI00068A6050|nr:phage tail tape measure protein [Bacillus sp. UNC438CL73TsuS30]